jgi:hypothetical protein
MSPHSSTREVAGYSGNQGIAWHGAARLSNASGREHLRQARKSLRGTKLR